MRRVGARQDYSTVNRAKVLRRSDPKSRKFLRDSRRSGVTRLNAKNRKEKSPKTARSALRSLFYVPSPAFVVSRSTNQGSACGLVLNASLSNVTFWVVTSDTAVAIYKEISPVPKIKPWAKDFLSQSAFPMALLLRDVLGVGRQSWEDEQSKNPIRSEFHSSS